MIIKAHCPFCGSSNVCPLDEEGISPRRVWVNCMDCDAQGPIKATVEEAVVAWSKPAEKIEKLQSDIVDLQNDLRDANERFPGDWWMAL